MYKILFVEDYEPTAITMGFIMDDLGHHMDHAETGRDALDLLNKEDGYDVVLVDIHLPDTTGMVLAEKIRSENTDVVIIGYTADPRSLSKEDSAVFDGVAEKRLNAEDIQEKLEGWLSA